MSQPPAGWYANPAAPHQRRWWDGTVWTDHVKAFDEITGKPFTALPTAPASTPGSANKAKTNSPTRNSAAAIGFGLGIASFFLFAFPILGPLLCLSAVVVSAIGISRHKPGSAREEKVVAIIGLVLGILYSLMVILYVAMGKM